MATTYPHHPDAIPGVATFHPRSDWESWNPKYKVQGPGVNQGALDTAVIHYTADDDLIDGDPGEYEYQLPQYLRNIQASYVNSRGYSIGYRWAVDWLGGVWQLRGWNIQSAANRGHNGHTEPILMLVDGNDRATAEAANSVRCIIKESQRRSGGKTFAVVGHSDIGSTQCPGYGLRAQVREGVFTPDANTGKPPSKPYDPIYYPGAEDDMYQPITPYRNSDTRVYGVPIKARHTYEFGLNPYIIPQDAKAVTLNLAVVGAGNPGFLAVWPSGPKPQASAVNYDGQGATNGATTIGVVNGKFCIEVTQPAHVIVDVTGYWK